MVFGFGHSDFFRDSSFVINHLVTAIFLTPSQPSSPLDLLDNRHRFPHSSGHAGPNNDPPLKPAYGPTPTSVGSATRRSGSAGDVTREQARQCPGRAGRG